MLFASASTSWTIFIASCLWGMVTLTPANPSGWSPRKAAVSVARVSCTLPGGAPLETVVLFWIAERRYQFKLFKPVAEVVVGDLPYAWLKDALAVEEGAGWECC